MWPYYLGGVAGPGREKIFYGKSDRSYLTAAYARMIKDLTSLSMVMYKAK